MIDCSQVGKSCSDVTKVGKNHLKYGISDEKFILYMFALCLIMVFLDLG